MHDARREQRLGLLYGLAAYGAWGVFPIYLKAVKTVPVVEVLCHRVVWALVVLVVVTAVRGEMRAVAAALRTSTRPARALRQHGADRGQLARLHLLRRARAHPREQPRVLHQPPRQRAPRGRPARRATVAAHEGGRRGRRGRGGLARHRPGPAALDLARAGVFVRFLRAAAQDRARRRPRRPQRGDAPPRSLLRRLPRVGDDARPLGLPVRRAGYQDPPSAGRAGDRGAAPVLRRRRATASPLHDGVPAVRVADPPVPAGRRRLQGAVRSWAGWARSPASGRRWSSSRSTASVAASRSRPSTPRGTCFRTVARL